MAKVIEAKNPHAAWATMSVRTVVTVFLYGVAVGLVTYAAYLLLERFVFEPILCREGAALVRCENTGDIAGGVAIVLGGFMGLTLLVRERIYRPILAVLGITISLWGMFSLLAALPIIVATLVGALLFALAYTVFAWLVQPTSLGISVGGVVLVCVLARLALG